MAEQDYRDAEFDDAIDLDDDMFDEELLEGELIPVDDYYDKSVPALVSEEEAALLAEPLSPEEARELTATIRSAAEMMWVLIARAHHGRAWEALGYESWGSYVRAEFDMSRSRSYQLLDQGRVIAAIEEALPEGAHVSLSEAAARDLKNILDEVLPAIRERASDLPPEEASLILDEIVEEQRDKLRAEKEDALADAPTYDPPADSHDIGLSDNPADGTPKKKKGQKGDGDLGYDDLDDFDGFPSDDDEPVYDETADIDSEQIRATVNATHDLYAALSALSSLPSDLHSVIAIIPADSPQVDENLEEAYATLKKFRKLWRNQDSMQEIDIDE